MRLAGPSKKALLLSRVFDALSGSDPEHDAFDRGLIDADRVFFENDLPELIASYQEVYRPEDNPYAAYAQQEEPESTPSPQFRLQ